MQCLNRALTTDRQQLYMPKLLCSSKLWLFNNSRYHYPSKKKRSSSAAQMQHWRETVHCPFSKITFHESPKKYTVLTTIPNDKNRSDTTEQ